VKACLLVALAGLYATFDKAASQDFSQPGFLDSSVVLYPQTAPNDSGRAVGQAFFQYEAFYKVSPRLRLASGIDAQIDTHSQVERIGDPSLWDRERQRPALEVRRANATYSSGKMTFEVGKQFIHWGRTDILTPTDRFGPRDYLNVLDNSFLAVTAARMIYGSQRPLEP